MDATVGWGQSLWYSINARPSALGHLIEPVLQLTRHVHRGKQFFVKLFDLLFQSATIVVLTCMFVLDKRNTLWLCDTVKQTSLRKSMARAKLWSAQRPLMFAWLYCVTIKYSYFIRGCLLPNKIVYMLLIAAAVCPFPYWSHKSWLMCQ